jgi:phosphoenolpyruvate carboxykinase (ATP)
MMKEFFSQISENQILKNAHKSLLIEKAIQNREARLGPNGELVVSTGSHTGRSADDKYVVKNSLTEDKIWWENNLHAMSDDTFTELEKDVLSFLKIQPELYYTEQSIGSLDHHSIGIDFISTQASAALFTQYMFKDFQAGGHNDHFTILHAPHFKFDLEKFKTRSGTVIVTCFKKKTTIIIGTLYAGEIKKSMFSVMNFVLPDLGILPMHSGANLNAKGESFVFFGLSGTGKTTLSTDEGTLLIGDDEHGLSDRGVFNFEGGCYAKTDKLAFETEPAIYQASTRYSSFLENVKLSEDQKSINFFDNSITENGRSSYPLEFINDRVQTGQGKVPKNLFFLSADAFGVLPPVSLLDSKQAKEFFVLGYTAKLAGTEIGLKSPKAAFSPCFGAPFMLRHPSVYANLLSQMINKHNIKVWLINTGWYGGGYGVGERFPLKITRGIIRAIQNHELDSTEMFYDEIFNLKIPMNLKEIKPEILIPQNAWKDKSAYQNEAIALASTFKEQIKKFNL